MDTLLHVLGTGNAMVTEVYNTCFVLENDRGLLMVDAGGGNGILRQMKDAGLSFSRVHDLFITHAHPDHLNGVVWVMRKILSMVDSGRYEGTLTVWCHESVREGMAVICRLMLQQKLLKYVGTRVIFRDIRDGMEAEWLGMPVTIMDIRSTKLTQFGFTLLLPDGKKLACLGDEPFNPACREQVEGSRWLLCEAFCLKADAERFRPYEKHHSTAADAAVLARELGVESLVLWHTEDETIATRKASYTAEAGQYFPGRVYVPDDLETIRLT